LLYRTYIAFDTVEAATIMRKMRQHGVILGTCGESTVRLRPMLIFEDKHGKFGITRVPYPTFKSILMLASVPILVNALKDVLGDDAS
jgi:hypothetical protein